MKSHPNGKIIRIINENNPFGDKVMYGLDHIQGFYCAHYVVLDNSLIFDPFLEKAIPKKDYLKKTYKNFRELRFSD